MTAKPDVIRDLMRDLCIDHKLSTLLDVMADYCDRRLADRDNLTGRERQNYRTLASKIRRASIYADDRKL